MRCWFGDRVSVVADRMKSVPAFRELQLKLVYACRSNHMDDDDVKLNTEVSLIGCEWANADEGGLTRH